MDIAFFVLLALVFGALAVWPAAMAGRRNRTQRLQREHEKAAAEALWEVRRLEESGKVFFYLWRYPGKTDRRPEWCVQLGQQDDVQFMDQHSAVLTAVEAERDRRNFELTEIRRAELKEIGYRKN